MYVQTPSYTGLKETTQRESLNETWDNKHNLKHNKDGTYYSEKEKNMSTQI